MRQEIARLDGKVDALAADVTDVRAVNRRIVATLVRLEGKVDDIAERMATKEDLAAVKKDVLGLAAKVDDMRFDWAKHEVRITDLERRGS